MKVWSFSIRPFTREGTNFLKGISIILIALHNYYKWVEPITGENEFGFSAANLVKCFVFIRGNPLEIVHVFFNFLGHYGVQTFILISAYGLTHSWNKEHPRYGRYLLHRIDKLYPPMWFGGLAFIIFAVFQTGNLINTAQLKDLGIQLTLFANLIPGKAMGVSGPWWFFSFIFQVYLVFPLILWVWSKTGLKGLAGIVILGYALTIGLYSPMMRLNLNPLTMVIGHLPEVCLGIYLAEKKEVRIPWWLMALAFLVVAGGNYFQWLWPFANLGVALLLVVFIQWLLRISNLAAVVFRTIVFIGTVSLYIFILQGFVRNPFIVLANRMSAPIPAFLIGVLFLAVVTGLAYLMTMTDFFSRKWIAASPSRKGMLGRFLALFLTAVTPVALLLILQGFTGSQESAEQKETIVFSRQNDFETPNPNYPNRYTTARFWQGKTGFAMPPPQSYAPGIEADFSKFDLTGVYEADASVMLFSNDSLSSGHLILEVWDVPSGQRLEWKSQFLAPGKFTLGKWFECRFVYPIPKQYLHSNYKIKTYLWGIGKGTFYADDLKLEIKARK